MNTRDFATWPAVKSLEDNMKFADLEIAAQVAELERRIQEKFDLQNAVVLRVSA
jgi:hypothetical protein